MAKVVVDQNFVDLIAGILLKAGRPMTTDEIADILKKNAGMERSEELFEKLMLTLHYKLQDDGRVRLIAKGSDVLYEATGKRKRLRQKKLPNGPVLIESKNKSKCPKCNGKGKLVSGKPGSRGLKQINCPDCENGWLRSY